MLRGPWAREQIPCDIGTSEREKCEPLAEDAAGYVTRGLGCERPGDVEIGCVAGGVLFKPESVQKALNGRHVILSGASDVECRHMGSIDVGCVGAEA
jgi:hypothetical protein